jgi:hypothetical protein
LLLLLILISSITVVQKVDEALIPLPGLIGQVQVKDFQFCIDRVWNESTALKFTLRNCGQWDASIEDFSVTKYSIDEVETACISDMRYTFNVYDVRTVSCPPGSYGMCTADAGCPTRNIKVVPKYGRGDNATYQYVPK